MPHEFNDDTLQDIKDRDVDNLEYVLKHAKTHSFVNITECIGFSGSALNAILQQHGVDIREFLNNPDAMDLILQKKGLRVEHREYDGEEDRTRSGIYIYRTVNGNSEIVGFIGKPQHGYIAGSYTITATVDI